MSTVASLAQPRIICIGEIAPCKPGTPPPPITYVISDEYTHGRSRFVGGGNLADCTNAAERCGYTSAESEARKADLRAMLAISFDEWRNDPTCMEGPF